MTDQLSDQQIDELKQAFGIFDKGTGETIFFVLFCVFFLPHLPSPESRWFGSMCAI